MSWEDEKSPGELGELLEASQLAEARELVQCFVDNVTSLARAVPNKVAKKVTNLLRSYAMFPELETAAECIRSNDIDNPRARVQYAQALIEQKRMTSAISELIDLQKDLDEWKTSDDPERRSAAIREMPEVVGLLGRSYKQLYVDAQPNSKEQRKEDLKRAIEFYEQAYDENPGDNFWHGVNCLALRTNAERVKTGNNKALNSQARKDAPVLIRLVDDYLDKHENDYWGLATKMEAYLATGETEQAIKACNECLSLEYPHVDRFMLHSTIRQLEEVWLLKEDIAPGDQILAPMKIRRAQLPGGTFIVDPNAPIDRDELQKVWGDTSYRPVEWLDQALARARAVARIGIGVHSGHGTGFLVDRGYFPGLESMKPLLLTNAHVCSPDPKIRHYYGALAPEDAVVAFLASDDREAIRGKVIFSSPPADLDATLMELERLPTGLTPPELAKNPDGSFPVIAGDRVSIIGHPHGGGMQVSIQDNKTTQVGERYLWYQTPTDPGSSGSPIFDQSWHLVGLHHSSKSVKKANEGVRIDLILKAIREKLEPKTTVPVAENPWDLAHEKLKALASVESAAPLKTSAGLAPDLPQQLEEPPALEGAKKAPTPKGLDPFWPPTDEEFRFGWHLGSDFSQLREACNEVGDPGNARIRIGILDTGYDPNHITKPLHLNTDLARNLTGEGDPRDAADRTGAGFLNNKGHGTATLALLAGAEVHHPDLPNGKDFLGGAPFLEVVPIRIADSVVHFRGDAIAEGIKYATEQGCRVISISMGGVPNQRWADAVNQAYEAGVVIVAAAGNRFGPSPPTTMVFPARFHRVIAACGATFNQDAYFRPGLHREMQGCFGPSGRMSSAIGAFTPNTPWATFGESQSVSNSGAGTSSATPQVAAAAALWLQKHMPTLPVEPWKCVEAVRYALFSTADKRGSADQFGNGLLRAKDALAVPPKLNLPKAEPAEVRFKWLRLVFGLEAAPEALPEPNARDALLENEALQLYLTSAEMLELAGDADPDEDLDEPCIKAVLEVMRNSDRTSKALIQRLDEMLGNF